MPTLKLDENGLKLHSHAPQSRRTLGRKSMSSPQGLCLVACVVMFATAWLSGLVITVMIHRKPGRMLYIYTISLFIKLLII
jgi:hypothetical protein